LKRHDDVLMNDRLIALSQPLHLEFLQGGFVGDIFSLLLARWEGNKGGIPDPLSVAPAGNEESQAAYGVTLIFEIALGVKNNG